jgi:hypothetical protein
MNKVKYFLVAAVAGIFFTVGAPKLGAQVSVGISVGAAPDCPYGYYGAEWFSGGTFIGAGQWFHGPENFQGHVNNRYDVQRGYRGARPNVGDKQEPSKRVDKVSHFKGNEMRDGRGHVSNGKK